MGGGLVGVPPPVGECDWPVDVGEFVVNGLMYADSCGFRDERQSVANNIESSGTRGAYCVQRQRVHLRRSRLQHEQCVASNFR